MGDYQPYLGWRIGRPLFYPKPYQAMAFSSTPDDFWPNAEKNEKMLDVMRDPILLFFHVGLLTSWRNAKLGIVCLQRRTA